MKNDKRRAIRFKGFDWTELLQLQRIATNWPTVPKDFNREDSEYFMLFGDDPESLYQIKTYLALCEGKEEKLACKYVRRFLAALARQDKAYGHDDHKIYIALAKADDGTMLSWVIPNLKRMWT